MLRVGLTGSLASGKSTVARMLSAHGAHVLSSDDIGRELMQPGQPVFLAILDRFGPGLLAPDGTLDRPALARLAFSPDHPDRLEALNAIVHPAVLARQAELIAQLAAREPHAVVVVESALLFETPHAGPEGWRARFDRIVLVRASDSLKIVRFAQRSFPGRTLEPPFAAELHAEAQRRLGRQLDDDFKAAQADYILTNDGSLAHLQSQVDTLWPILAAQA